MRHRHHLHQQSRAGRTRSRSSRREGEDSDDDFSDSEDDLAYEGTDLANRCRYMRHTDLPGMVHFKNRRARLKDKAKEKKPQLHMVTIQLHHTDLFTINTAAAMAHDRLACNWLSEERSG